MFIRQKNGTKKTMPNICRVKEASKNQLVIPAQAGIQ
jgi:hypothetical protein